MNSFVDNNPKGFGLLQRDRAFHNYQDDGVFYNRRPSLWVELLGEWGPGAVQLVEIPTDDEIHDNVVAYWVPDEPIKAGSEWSFHYRLYWVDQEPFPPEEAARVIHTRLGNGGVPGQPRPANTRKFVIDFEGGPLERLEKQDKVMPIVTDDPRHGQQRLRAADRRHQALARLLRPAGRGPRPRQPALLPAPGRLSPVRDLALRVHAHP